MKSIKDFPKATAEDSLRRASKLDPMRRSGKERHQLYKSLSLSDPDDEADDDYQPQRRESILDYMDSQDQDQDEDQDEDQYEDQDQAKEQF